MRSRTSFFNKTLFTKTVSSLWPLWAAYLLIWFIALPINIAQSISHGVSSGDLVYYILNVVSYGGVVIGFFTAAVSAVFVWLFAYSSRSASGIACLPLKRENVFVSSVLAGLVPIVVLNVVIALVLTLIAMGTGTLVVGASWQFAAIATLQYICFYGLATLCCQLTGNPVVAGTVYLIFSFVVPVVNALCNVIAQLFIFGLTTDTIFSNWSIMLSPAAQLITTGISYTIKNGFYTDVCYIGWKWLLIYLVVALIMLAGALLIFRRRNMETAGDTIALKPLRPVFKYCFTFGFAMAFPLFMYVNLTIFDNTGLENVNSLALLFAFWGIVGAFIGYFGSEMALNKTLKVWRGKWTGFLISALIVIACTGCLRFDLLGVGRWVPDVKNVACVDLDHAYDGMDRRVSSPENIEKVIDIHRRAIASRSQGVESSIEYDNVYYDSVRHYTEDIRLTYTMKSGRTVVREYFVPYYEGGDLTDTSPIVEDYRALRSCDEVKAYIHEQSMNSDRNISVSSAYLNVYLSSDMIEDFLPNVPGPCAIGEDFYLIDPDESDEVKFNAVPEAVDEAIYGGKYDYSMGYETWKRLDPEIQAHYYCLVDLRISEDSAMQLYNICVSNDVPNRQYDYDYDMNNDSNVSIRISFRSEGSRGDVRWYYYDASIPIDAENVTALLESWNIPITQLDKIIPID